MKIEIILISNDKDDNNEDDNTNNNNDNGYTNGSGGNDSNDENPADAPFIHPLDTIFLYILRQSITGDLLPPLRHRYPFKIPQTCSNQFGKSP